MYTFMAMCWGFCGLHAPCSVLRATHIETIFGRAESELESDGAFANLDPLALDALLTRWRVYGCVARDFAYQLADKPVPENSEPSK